MIDSKITQPYHRVSMGRARRTTFPTTLLLPLLAAIAVGCASHPHEDVLQPATPTATTAPAVPQSAVDESDAAADGPTQTADIGAEPAPPEYDDLWDRVRAGFALPELRNEHVEYYERWHRDRPEYVERMVGRASRYLYFVVEEVQKRGMPMEIALLPAIESAFKPYAYSRARAAGLWQFIPSTGTHYGLKQNWWYDGRRDVVSATRAALDYLEKLHNEFHGDWFLALAAYNAGERRVQQAIQYNVRRGRPAGFAHLRLKPETLRYVPKLIAVRNIVDDPARYGLALARIPNEPFFAEVDAGDQIDIGVIALKAGLDEDELRQLNPGFKRWATDPSGPHRLLVPYDKVDAVEQVLAELTPNQRMRWAHYRVRRGDTLSRIAHVHGVSVNAIQRANGLRGTRIRAGADLLIPVSYQTIAAIDRAKPSGPTVHKVRSGDTLWGIARRYNVYIGQLTRWNAIKANDVLRLGQKIVVYEN